MRSHIRKPITLATNNKNRQLLYKEPDNEINISCLEALKASA